VSTSLLKKAKRYKKMGLRPLPLGRSLHPWVEWKKFRNREPTDDEIEEWFADSKTIGIGAITGQVGDLEILGIDVDHKGGKNGWEALEEKGIKRLKAPTVHTPTNDGAHAIFLHPDVHIPSFDLMPGVEIKADGAMLVLDAPGYEWDEDLNLEDTEVPPLPKKVLALVTSSPRMRLARGPDESDVIEVDEDDVAHDVYEEELAPFEPALPSDGYLADYVAHSRAHTMTPPEFALAVGLVQMSALLVGHLMYRGHQKNDSPCVWVALIAEPGGKKSSSITAGTTMLEEACGRKGSVRLPTKFTVEHLEDALQERPYGYSEWSEMARFMSSSANQKWMAEAKDFLSELFDSPPQMESGTRTGGDKSFENAAVTIVGATTVNNFNNYVRADDIEGGFLTRWVFVPQVSSVDYKGLEDANSPVATEGRRDLTRNLRRLRKKVAQLHDDGDPLRVFEISSKAMRAIDAYDRHVLTDLEAPHLVRGFKNRLGMYTAKLSMCYALARGSFKVQERDVGHAVAFLEFCRTRAWPWIVEAASVQTYSGRNIERVRLKLIDMSRQGTKWVAWGEACRAAHMKEREFREIIETLEATGQVIVRMNVATGGRPGKVVFLTELGRWGIRR